MLAAMHGQCSRDGHRILESRAKRKTFCWEAKQSVPCMRSDAWATSGNDTHNTRCPCVLAIMQCGLMDKYHLKPCEISSAALQENRFSTDMERPV